MHEFTQIGNKVSGDYKCVSCANTRYSVIRADKENPRLKCGGCGFVYNGADSVAAQEAGALRSSAETLASAEEPERELADVSVSIREKQTTMLHSPSPDIRTHQAVPSRPKYVFIGRDNSVEFCGAKDVKRVALKWHDTPHKVYELSPKSFAVKVDIS